jgi:hypothetical protein
MVFLSLMSFIGKYNNTYNKIFYYLFITFLFFFIGFRYKISWDWGNYSNIYEQYKYLTVNEVLEGVEPLFGLTNLLSAHLGFSDILFNNIVFSIIVCIFLHKFLIRLKAYWLGLFMYFPVHILVVSMGYVRQSVAIAILLYAMLKLWDKKSFQFVFWVLIASFFHRTAIIMLLFFPLCFLNLKGTWEKLYYTFAVISITTILYLSTVDESNVYTTGEVSSAGTYLRLFLHIVPIFYYLKYRHSFFKIKFPDFYKVLDLFAILIGMCFFLSVGFSTLADRFSLYLVFFNLFVCMSLYFYLPHQEKFKLVLFIVISYMLSFSIWKIFGFGADDSYIYQNYIINYLSESVF